MKVCICYQASQQWQTMWRHLALYVSAGTWRRYKLNFLKVVDSTVSANIMREASKITLIRRQGLTVDQNITVLLPPHDCRVHRMEEALEPTRIYMYVALNHSPSVFRSAKNLLRVIAYPDHTTSKCPKCDATEMGDFPSLPVHLINEHTNSESSWDTLMDALAGMDPSFISQALCLSNSFNLFTLHFLYTPLCLTFMFVHFFVLMYFQCPGRPM